MNLRLIFDYLKRWQVFTIVPCYSAIIAVFTISTGDPSMSVLLSCLAFGLYGFVYFPMEVHLHNTIRFQRTLPLSKRKIVNSLWFEGVLAPVIIALSVSLLGMIFAYVQFSFNLGNVKVKALPKDLSSHVMFFSIVWSLYAASFFIAFTTFRTWNKGAFWGAIYAICTIVYFVFFLFLLKFINDISKFIFFMGALSLLLYSYRCAFRLADLYPTNQSNQKRTVADIDYRNQHLTLNGFERIQSHPFVSLTISSILPILIATGLICSEPYLYEHTGGLVAFFGIIGAFTLFIFIFSFRWGDLIGSMRLLVALPIPRNKILASLVMLPVLTFTPLFVLPKMGIPLSSFIYFLLVSVCLLNNAVHLRWGTYGVAFSLNLVGVVIFTSLAIVSKKSAFFLFLYGNKLHYVLVFLLAVLSILWMYRLLHKSSAPFSHKPSIGGFN